jgi:hypothetical protein
MPPRYPGQSLFLKAQATEGKNDPEYTEALNESESTFSRETPSVLWAI